MTYARSVLIAIDQLGNAIAGGNPDCTISGRIGYFSQKAVHPAVFYWLFLQIIVDLTFYPWDGEGHCRQSYEKEKFNKFYELKSFRVLALFMLSLFTLSSCLIMCPLFWAIYGIKLLVKKITMS